MYQKSNVCLECTLGPVRSTTKSFSDSSNQNQYFLIKFTLNRRMIAAESSSFSFHAPAATLPIVLEERSSQVYVPTPVKGDVVMPVPLQHGPSRILLKQNASGAKRKRDEPAVFECLEGEGGHTRGMEPELDSEDESSSDEDQEQKMPRLPSSSGTTRSTGSGGGLEPQEDSPGMLPVFKSYHPDFISPILAEVSNLGEPGEKPKTKSPIRHLHMEAGDDVVEAVEVTCTQMEVTSPPTIPVPGSQCLPGRKHEFSHTESAAVEPTGDPSSLYFYSA